MLNKFVHTSKKILGTIMGRKFTRVRQVFIILVFVFSLIGVNPVNVSAATITFTGTELLGRPETDRISISVVPDAAASIRYQYGTTSGGPYTNTANYAATAGTPLVVTITGLTANTKYYYRMQYSTDSWATSTTRTERSFWTQRAKGSTFTFDITSDGHVNILLGNATTWQNTMNGVATDQPDFALDLGDTIAMRGLSAGDTTGAETAYKYGLPFFDTFSHSAPVFLVQGNHEQTEGWHLQDPLTGSLPVIGTNAEKKFYLDPAPDSFYSGNTSNYTPLGGDNKRLDYYSWTWGDALFVVIDPYWYTASRPYISDPGGGETDATGTGDSWDWTLGLDQFNWLKTTLAGSNAKYKFIFAHQMVGGNPAMSGQNDYGHGGANYAQYVEWGGKNEDGTTDGWAANRDTATWGTKPIHQILVDNHVSAFIHGHDHGSAFESRDGVAYISVPAAGFNGNFNIYSTGSGYTTWADSNEYAARIKVAVSPTQATFTFIRTSNGDTLSTQTILPNAVTTKARDDYDGDGKTDAVKFVSNSTNSKTAWDYGSLTSTWNGLWLGTESTMAYVGASDFDGDGKTDMAKFLSSNNSVWYYKSSTSAWDGIWLGSGTIANYVAGSDFDGDGKTDPAKFFSSPDVLWYWSSKNAAWTGVYLGTETVNYVSGSDFDGDGKTDPAKYVPSTYVLWYLKSSTGTWSGLYMGSDTTAYVAASDFDGDGKTDPAKIISGGTLYYYSSLSSSWVSVTVGTGYTSYIAGCDFNGDGKTDPAKYDEGTHLLSWYNGSTWADIDMGTDTFTIGNGQ